MFGSIDFKRKWWLVVLKRKPQSGSPAKGWGNVFVVPPLGGLFRTARTIELACCSEKPA